MKRIFGHRAGWMRWGSFALLLALMALGPVDDAAAKSLNVKTYFTAIEGRNSVFLRAVEWLEPVFNKPFSVCANNKNPATDYCFVAITCAPGNAGVFEPFAFIKGYRLTDVDVRQALLALPVSELNISNSASCVRPHPPTILKDPIMQVAAYTEVPYPGTRWTNDGFLFKVDIDIADENTQCHVQKKNLDVDFGNVLTTEANGAERVVNLDIACTIGNGYAQLTVPGYNDVTGIALRPDNSLQARISFGEGKTPADLASIYKVTANTTRSVPVTVTLKAPPGVKGGVFNASTVIHINYM